MKNNNQLRRTPARRLSLLAVCITMVMTPAMQVIADSTSELMMFAEMSGHRPAAPAVPVQRAPTVRAPVQTYAPPAVPVAPSQPLFTSPPSAVPAAVPAAPARGVVQPVPEQPAPVSAAPAHAFVQPVPEQSASVPAAQSNTFVQAAPVPSAAPGQQTQQGGRFLTEAQRQPAPPRSEPVLQAVQAFTPPPATPRPVSNNRASTTAGFRYVSPPPAAAASTTIAQSPVSLSGGSRETVAESELRQKLLSAVRIAWRISPVLKSYVAQTDAALASVDEAKGQRWPQLDVGASSPTKEFGSGVKSYENQSNIPSLSVSVATNLIDFGQTSRTIESRQQRAISAQQAVQAQREDLAMQVTNALIEWNKQQHVITISQQFVARMKELTTMLSGIVQSDAGRRSELTQAKGRLLQAQSYLENARSRARDVEITLQRLIGDNRITLPASHRWAMNFGDLHHQLASLDRHPLILRAKAEEQAAFKEAQAIKASGLPKLNWTVNKSTREDQLGRQQAWQTGLNVSWGLFRGGSVTAQEIAAIKRAEASRQQVQEQRRDLENRVRAANQDAHATAERAELYKNLIAESDRIRKDFFDQWYHLGRRTLLDVLSAESDLYNNQVNEVSNRFDSYAAILRGYSSAGTLSRWLTTGR